MHGRARDHREARQSTGRRGELTEERHPYRLGTLGVLVERNPDNLATSQRPQYFTRRLALADNMNSTPLPNKGHKRLPGRKTLGMMDQTCREAMHRVSGSEKLEIPYMRRQREHTFARMLPLRLVKVIEARVGHTAFQARMKEPCQPDVLGACPTEIYVRLAQNSPAFIFAAFGKCDFEVAHPDSGVATVQVIAEPAACDAERIQNKVGQDAQRVNRAGEQPENYPILRAELRLRRFGFVGIGQGRRSFNLTKRYR